MSILSFSTSGSPISIKKECVQNREGWGGGGGGKAEKMEGKGKSYSSSRRLRCLS